ncbi:Mannose-6-phosphate isomerase [Endocarpon pusillum Z07020]|uniref:Mannose-6-phosphate isomerase n=1 Tax=Endocarpon pusillum (strain Z07020 / HMAS-L-300199) TaxID=1263415 RepID=U1I469_ENDPU|nr:Mannose-6-phosphate isomerase [Endocarpon pusillum Z07020]ERF76894.1 Mannose-6-phosphate isomerase [Endocarpon pusillum Z07020]
MQVPLIRLQCGVNSYDWGKKGKDSAAAKYALATPPDGFSIEEEKPYAEVCLLLTSPVKHQTDQAKLWMGTHPSLPSKDLETGRSLLDLVSDNQALMSTEISKKYNNKLPFLFKVLSISKALSIQAHPNKKLAGELHAKDPKNYPDDNHKPEMAIAITHFEGLCGFRPLKEIAHFLKTIPPLRALVGEDRASSLETTAAAEDCDLVTSKSSLRAAFTALMKSAPEDVRAMSKSLVSQAESQEISPGPSLAPGQAMYLKADDIHAYVSGDIIECMASSDNVIRAGFTPKFQDVNTLTEILTYDHDPPAQQLLQPVDYPYVTLNTAAYGSGSDSLLYDPPIEEFSVVRTALKADGAKATFEGIAGPSVVICTSGQGSISVGPKREELKEGFVYFVGATAECVIESRGADMVTFKAFCEIEDGKGERETNGH